MSKRRSIFVGVRYPSKRLTRPIKLPQPIVRPLQIHQRNLVKENIVSPDRPAGMTVHRRGPIRRRIGQDPLEARAVSKNQVRGTLPERIIYKWLSDHNIPFDFQSSLLGGRLEFGGIVADFILEEKKLVINPAGPTHTEFVRVRKDEEQTMILAEMGYTQYIIPEDDVYNEAKFEEIMRAILNLGPTWGGGSADNTPVLSYRDEADPTLDEIYRLAVRLYDTAMRLP